MKINTGVLQRLVGTAVKGCTFNKIVPITSLVHLKSENGLLTITTTDALNVLEVSHKLEGESEDFQVVLEAKQFHDLVSRTTTKEVEMTLKQEGDGHFLEFIGNGTYVLEVPMVLEEGQNFTVKLVRDPDAKEINVVLKDLQRSMKLAETALPETLESPELLSYYIMEDIILTSDAFKVSSIKNLEQLKDEEINFTVDFVNLLQAISVNDKEEVTMRVGKATIEVIGSDFNITGQQSLYKDVYPLEDIMSFLGATIPNYVTVSRDDVLQTLNRLNLFVSVFDKNTIQVDFGVNDITITSKRQTGKEIIDTKESEITKEDAPTSVLVDLVMLEQQLEAHPQGDIKIYYGDSAAIKVESEDITQIISLLGDN